MIFADHRGLGPNSHIWGFGAKKIYFLNNSRATHESFSKKVLKKHLGWRSFLKTQFYKNDLHHR